MGLFSKKYTPRQLQSKLKRLNDAIETKNLQKIVKRLDRTPKEVFSMKDPNGNIPLGNAILTNDIRVVNLFRNRLNFNYDLSTQNTDGNTPIHLALINRTHEIIEIVHNIEVIFAENPKLIYTKKNNLGLTPLALAKTLHDDGRLSKNSFDLLERYTAFITTPEISRENILFMKPSTINMIFENFKRCDNASGADTKAKILDTIAKYMGSSVNKNNFNNYPSDSHEGIETLKEDKKFLLLSTNVNLHTANKYLFNRAQSYSRQRQQTIEPSAPPIELMRLNDAVPSHRNQSNYYHQVNAQNSAHFAMNAGIQIVLENTTI